MTCSVCDAEDRITINGMSYCSTHAWEGIKHACAVEAMEKGAPPEVATRMAIDMVLRLLDEMAEGNP